MKHTLTENNLPKSVKVVLHHFHRGNSSRKARKGHDYMTMCRLFDSKTHELLGHGEAYCSRKDLPRRSIGRTVAIGRAMKEAGLRHHLMNTGHGDTDPKQAQCILLKAQR